MELDSAAAYEALIEHGADVITVVDESGVIQYESPAVESVLGREPGALVGESAFEYIHPDDRERVLEAFQEVVGAPGTVTDRETYRFRHADGSWVWLESTTTNRTDTALDGYVVNSRDVTERKRYQAELEARTEQLETLNRIVRHDIRNDMSTILGWGEYLEDHVDEAAADRLELILASGEHIVELTDIARDYVETITGDGEPDIEPTPLGGILRTELELRRESFPEADIVVEGELPNVAVRANEMLGSVFRNLLNNAVQHNDRDNPTVEVSATVADGTATVRVADDGPGIPDEQKARVFGKGERGLGSPGTGIGLYLVRTLVEGFDGEVRIEDNEPRGAVFIVELPLAGE